MTFDARHYVMLGVAIVGVITGGIAGYEHFTSVAPSWLTPDVGGTCAITAGICGGIEGLLTQMYTPAKRAAELLRAKAGILPRDITRKFKLKETETTTVD